LTITARPTRAGPLAVSAASAAGVVGTLRPRRRAALALCARKRAKKLK